jgi:hypothetical protein
MRFSDQAPPEAQLTRTSLVRKRLVGAVVLVLIDDRDQVESGSRLP